MGDLHLGYYREKMKHFLSCDWGSSSFRLKLVIKETLETVAEVHNNIGIVATNMNWQKQANGLDRFTFFTSVIKSAIEELRKKVNEPIDGLPVILSGMASSTMGMIQLPYKRMPFKTDGSDLIVEHVKASREFGHDVFVISGACSDNDVMRGEETQLVGAVDGDSGVKTVYILPGTHSKHISVKDGIAYDFKTYMTGEIFSLLSKNSTLTESLMGTDEFDSENFTAGVGDSVKSTLLNQMFNVRSRFLLDKKEPVENRSYLSGLLIGSEVREILTHKIEKIVIVSTGMAEHYKAALRVLNIQASATVMRDDNVAIRGQMRIVSHRR